jgi:nitrogen fixation/metabolism regulation signal transduction histidine kinase
MKNKNVTLLIFLLVFIILLFSGLWFTGTFDKIFSAQVQQTVGNTLALDLETLQNTIRTVSSKSIDNLAFVEAIDTLSANADLSKMRNPFVRVYVAPPPKPKEDKPEPKATQKKTTKKAAPRKKRIVRPKITINGIIWDRSAPYAILNNDIYGEGDQIQGYTVQTIQDTMIVLGNSDDIFSIVIERE